MYNDFIILFCFTGKCIVHLITQSGLLCNNKSLVSNNRNTFLDRHTPALRYNLKGECNEGIYVKYAFQTDKKCTNFLINKKVFFLNQRSFITSLISSYIFIYLFNLFIHDFSTGIIHNTRI